MCAGQNIMQVSGVIQGQGLNMVTTELIDQELLNLKNMHTNTKTLSHIQFNLQAMLTLTDKKTNQQTDSQQTLLN